MQPSDRARNWATTAVSIAHDMLTIRYAWFVRFLNRECALLPFFGWRVCVWMRSSRIVQGAGLLKLRELSGIERASFPSVAGRLR